MRDKEDEQPEVLAASETAENELEDSQNQEGPKDYDPLTTRQVGRLPARAFRR